MVLTGLNPCRLWGVVGIVLMSLWQLYFFRLTELGYLENIYAVPRQRKTFISDHHWEGQQPYNLHFLLGFCRCELTGSSYILWWCSAI